MTEVYQHGNRHYVYKAIYIPTYERDGVEYPGYDRHWVLGREREPSNYHDEYYRSPSYYPRPRSSHYPRTHFDQPARLAWPTEIPVRLRVSICCEGCKIKMDKALRNIPDVYDVSISGWRNAMVTVTGNVSKRKILKEARKVAKSADLWSDDEHAGHSSYYNYGGHY